MALVVVGVAMLGVAATGLLGVVAVEVVAVEGVDWGWCLQHRSVRGLAHYQPMSRRTAVQATLPIKW